MIQKRKRKMDNIWNIIKSQFSGIYFPDIGWSDVLDIIIIAYVLYHVLLWIKTSRAWTLLKGVLVVALFLVIAVIFRFNTILWIARNMINVFLVAIIILFQPELRRALDELGRKKIISRFISFDGKRNAESSLSDKSIYELVKTCVLLSKDKTGALIVIEHETPLGEYINTGIAVDASISHQLLINIFEKNTPLHDGAVIIKDNRVVAATCYLPLTDRHDVDKILGTRHRAGLGISESTDCMTIIVSEETGGITVAYKGVLYQDLDEDGLRKQLTKIQTVKEDKTSGTKVLKLGGKKNAQ